MTAWLELIRAVIFDMDGVLFSSTDCHEHAFRQTLQEVGVSELDYPSISGMRTDEAFVKVFAGHQETLSQEKLQTLVTAKQARARALLAKRGQLAEGSDQLLSMLRKRYRLALASSASRGTIDIYLSKTAQANAFQVILDGSQVRASKPAPDIYLRAAEQLGVDPKQCLVVEDAVSGVEAAVAAGMRVIAVTGTDSPAILKKAGAVRVVQGLQAIESILLQKK